MPGRKPVVAGKFYPGQKNLLEQEVRSYLDAGKQWAKDKESGDVWAVMLPHAGHIFCGRIIGETLAGVKLPQRLIILCPNHTGYGQALGVWPEGAWLTPLGEVAVDKELAGELLASGGGYEADIASHLGEHSIEVLLPFLQESIVDPQIVPVTVGIRNPALLKRAGSALATVLRMPGNGNVGVIISSDMNHYEAHGTTLAKDELALEQARLGNPDGLLEVTAANSISMCGAGPLALALYAARDLGYAGVEVTDHDTSGPVSGDFEHTVGYAGLHLLKNKKIS